MAAAVFTLNSYTKTSIEIRHRQRIRLEEARAASHAPSYDEVITEGGVDGDGVGIYSVNRLLHQAQQSTLMENIWPGHTLVMGPGGVGHMPAGGMVMGQGGVGHMHGGSMVIGPEGGGHMHGGSMVMGQGGVGHMHRGSIVMGQGGVGHMHGGSMVMVGGCGTEGCEDCEREMDEMEEAQEVEDEEDDYIREREDDLC